MRRSIFPSADSMGAATQASRKLLLLENWKTAFGGNTNDLQLS
jgi:hypothetical protein